MHDKRMGTGTVRAQDDQHTTVVQLSDGASLRVHDQATGPAVLCLSGLGGTAGFWDPCVPLLSNRFRVLRLDQRGISGSTRGTAHCSIDRLASDCLEVLNARDVAQVILLGHSTGGCIAQAMALRAPTRIRALVLSASWACVDVYVQALFRMRLDLLSGNPQAYASTAAFLSYEPAWLKAHWRVYESALSHAPIDRVAQQVIRERIEALMAFDLTDQLGSITCPSLVIGSRDDALIPSYLQQDLAARLPQAELKLLNRGGHFFPVTRTPSYVDTVMKWLLRQNL